MHRRSAPLAEHSRNGCKLKCHETEYQTMTIGITGRRRPAPSRRIVMTLLMGAVVAAIGLIVLGLTGDFLVDWLWFSAIGYLPVFWTIIGANTLLFLAAFLTAAIILWVNGWFASRYARPLWKQRPTDFDRSHAGTATLPDTLEFLRHRLPWPLVIAGSAGLLAALVAWGEANNWG